MKRFKFKLQAVLKVREISEEKCRQEMGQLVTKREGLLKEIKTIRSHIEAGYHEQETMLKSGTSARGLTYFSDLFFSREKSIEIIEDEIRKLDTDIDEKRQDLVQRQADLKLINKLKEKHFEEYRKNYIKEQFKKEEEQVRLWQQNIKSV